jgi:hypothetical protein
MANWKHQLPNSDKIRELIASEEDNKALLEEIKTALLWIANTCKLDKNFFLELDDVNEALELEAFEEDEVNARLRDLYDLCDDNRVWIAL